MSACRRVERRLDVAAAPAPAAAGAARTIFVVQDAVGRDAGAAGNVVPPHLRDRALERHLDAIELRRPLKHAVRHLREPFIGPGTSEQHVDLVVVRLHVVVRDRPVDVEAVAAGGVELQRSVPQRAAAPEVGLAAEDARPHPRVRRAGGRVLPLVHHPVAGEPVGRVRDDLLVLREGGIGSVGAVEKAVLGDVDRALAWRQPVSPHRRVGPLHRPVLGADVDHPARFEQQHLDAGHRQLERRHPSGRAAADDDDVPAIAAGFDRVGEPLRLVERAGQVDVERGSACIG